MASEVFTIEIPINVDDQSGAGIKSATENFTALDKVIKDFQKTLQGLNKNGANFGSSGTTGFERSIERAQKKAQKLTTTKFEMKIAAVDKATKVITDVTRKARTLIAKPFKVGVTLLDKVTGPLRRVFSLFRNPLFTIGATIGVSMGISNAVETYAGFESTMSKVKALSGATNAELQSMTKTAEHLGDTTKYTATEVGEAMSYMSMAGWSAKETNSAISSVMTLAAASGESLSTVSDIVTDDMTAFKMAANEADHFADVLAVGATATNTTVGMMGETYKYVGSIAGTMGYSIEDATVAVGLMANASIKGSMAGTALRSAISNMTSPTDKQASVMDELNLSMTDGHGKAKDLMTIMKDLRRSFSGLSSTEQTQKAFELFGDRGATGMLSIITASKDEFDELTEQVYNANGAAQRMQEEMLDNLQGAYDLMTSAIDGAKRTLGERLAPWLRQAMSWITDQMPAVKDAINDVMDVVDSKLRGIQDKFSTLTLTDEWQNADFFGKVSIAWDELIAQPFSDWWSDTGSKIANDISSGIGSALGSGLGGGLKFLLGDVDAVGAGQNIGGSFLSGFLDGFDLDGVWDAIKGWASEHKVLAAAAGSYLGLSLVGGISGKIGSAAKTISSLKNVFSGNGLLNMFSGSGGSPLGTSTTPVMNVTASVVNVSGGTGGLSGTGINPGTSVGSNGTGRAAGLKNGIKQIAVMVGVEEGARALSQGFEDADTAINSKSPEESDAYLGSSIISAGLTVAGGLAGFALGGPMGAAIGAGIGGRVGTTIGDGFKNEYQQEQEALDKRARAQKATRYESEALKKAIQDTSISTEEFNQLFAEEATKTAQKHFGDITLSAKELDSVAKGLVFGNMAGKLDTFASAAEKTSESFSTLSGNYSAVEQWSWQAGLGMTLSNTDVDSYKKTVDAYIESAQDYLNQNHYELNAAATLMFGEKEGKSYMNTADGMYEEYQNKITGLGDKLSDKLEIYLKDGVLSLDEQKEVDKLIQQIQEITGKVSDAESAATLDSIQLKYGGKGSNMSYESFTGLQSEMAKYVESETGNLDAANLKLLTNLELEFSEGRISEEKLNEEKEKLRTSYQEKMKELELKVSGVQLEILGDSYNLNTDQLKTGFQQAIEDGVNPEDWITELEGGGFKASALLDKYFNLDGLGEDAKASLAQCVSSLQSTLPQQFSTVYDSLLSSADAEGSKAAAEAYSTTLNHINSQFGNPILATATANVAMVWNLTNADAHITTTRNGNNLSAHISSSGTSGTRSTPSSSAANQAKYVKAGHARRYGKYASGGILTKPHLGLVAEAGPEAIIPLSPNKASRGIELWTKAGRALGVFPHADGGIFGTTGSDSAPVDTAVSGAVNMPVNININNNVNVSGGDNKAEIDAKVDDVCNQIAENLQKVFDNLPVNA